MTSTDNRFAIPGRQLPVAPAHPTAATHDRRGETHPVLLVSVYGRPLHRANGYPGTADAMNTILDVLLDEITTSGWSVTTNEDDPVDAELELLLFDADLLSGDWHLDPAPGERRIGTAAPPTEQDAVHLGRAVRNWLFTLTSSG